MGLLKGSISLTRYRVMEQPADITTEFMSERLRRNAFLDIEQTAEEESMGWVEVLNPLATTFDPINFAFGQIVVLGLRVDHRKVPAKTVARYLSLAEAQAQEAAGGRPLSSQQRRQLKEQVQQDLLLRIPLSTDLVEVCWLLKLQEIWLAATGTKARERFEDLWRRTFGLGLLMKIPFILAQGLLPPGLDQGVLEQARPTAFFRG